MTTGAAQTLPMRPPLTTAKRNLTKRLPKEKARAKLALTSKRKRSQNLRRIGRRSNKSVPNLPITKLPLSRNPRW